MNYVKNIKTYYVYSTFADLLIIGPIITLFLFAKGLTFTQIMLLASISSIMIVAFEVPTGAIADKIGRKYSLVLGNLLWGICLLGYIFSNHFIFFIISEVAFSLGAAFKSGADTALIYDSLKMEGREQEFQHVEGHARSLSLYALAVGAIVAGFVYKINMYLPMIISIGFMVIAAIIASTLKEPPIKKEHENVQSYLKQIKESGKYILSHEKIKAIIFYSMIFYIFSRASFWYYQPYMAGVNIPVEYFGVIFFAFNIVAALSSKYSYKIMNLTKPKTLTFMSLLMIVSFILLGTIHIWIGVAAILLQQVARGIYRPVTTKYLNKHIPSDKRATLLSFQSFTANIASAAAMPLLGLLSDSTNIFTTHLGVAAAMIVLTYITIRYMDKRLGVNYKNAQVKVEHA